MPPPARRDRGAGHDLAGRTGTPSGDAATRRPWNGPRQGNPYARRISHVCRTNSGTVTGPRCPRRRRWADFRSWATIGHGDEPARANATVGDRPGHRGALGRRVDHRPRAMGGVMILFAVSVVLAMLLNPAVRQLRRLGISRGHGSVHPVAGVVVVVGGGIYLLVDPIRSEVQVRAGQPARIHQAGQGADQYPAAVLQPPWDQGQRRSAASIRASPACSTGSTGSPTTAVLQPGRADVPRLADRRARGARSTCSSMRPRIVAFAETARRPRRGGAAARIERTLGGVYQGAGADLADHRRLVGRGDVGPGGRGHLPAGRDVCGDLRGLGVLCGVHPVRRADPGGVAAAAAGVRDLTAGDGRRSRSPSS